MRRTAVAVIILVLGAMPLAAEDDVAPAIPTTAGPAVPFALAPVVSSPILTVDFNALFTGSAWGKRFQAEFEQATRDLATENDRIYAELAAEETALTEARKSLAAEDFRSRAEAFDQKVQSSRRNWEVRRRDLTQRPEAEMEAFRNASLPVFDQVMRERAALAILDQRAVFLSRDAVDVTSDLISRIDAEVGAGPPMQPLIDPATIPAIPENGTADGLTPPSLP